MLISTAASFLFYSSNALSSRFSALSSPTSAAVATDCCLFSSSSSSSSSSASPARAPSAHTGLCTGCHTLESGCGATVICCKAASSAARMSAASGFAVAKSAGHVNTSSPLPGPAAPLCAGHNGAEETDQQARTDQGHRQEGTRERWMLLLATQFAHSPGCRCSSNSSASLPIWCCTGRDRL